MDLLSIERLRLIASPVALDQLELAVEQLVNPDLRAAAISADHPEFKPALREGRDQIDVDGQRISIALHLTVHGLLANQLVAGDPPELLDAARRLMAGGFPRHTVLHMLASALVDQLPATRPGDHGYDRERHLAALRALPEAWEERRRRASHTGHPATDSAR
ncbi:MAG: hypothetical protein ACYDHH_29630 [Solirubrobacteraceae bacterium]